jgi:predicted Ser/Thr protein kinase
MALYSPLQPGDPVRLDRYELVGRLGQGGMGVVFLGQDDLGLVAIKTIPSAYVSDEEVRRRFRREAEAASRVPRRCTAQVYESDFQHDPPFIVSEYIKGPTLAAEVKKRGPLPAPRLYGVAIGVAAALRQIHQVPIVHRDLKPQNVLLSPYGPRVIDFGIARVPDQTASSSGHIMGTPAYMAPEHFDHREVDRPADVFAWGSVMAFAGTGRPPFGEGSSPQIGYRIIHDPPDLEGLDPTMRRLVEAALRKDPGQRPTASWLQEELKQAARTAKADQGRAMEVDQVLEHAREGPDRPVPTMPLLATPPAPDGFVPRSIGVLFVLAAVVLVLGVWLDTLGGLGTATRSSARWLFGYGAYALPLLAGWWGVALLLRPRTALLWPEGRDALAERTAQSAGRAIWHGIRAILRSPMAIGPLAIFVGGLGLVQLARRAPPIRGTPLERDQSGGVVGAFLGKLNPALSPWGARLALTALVAAGAVTVARFTWRRWGTWPALVVLLICLAASISPALYLKDRHYQYWVTLDASGHLAVVEGLAAQRARQFETTVLTVDDVPPELQRQLKAGVPAADLQDARRLARALASAYQQLTGSHTINDRRGALSVGTCIDRTEPGATTVPCSQPHAAEVYGIVAAPYQRFPGATALDDFAKGACQGLFDDYLGIAYEQTMLDFKPLPPVDPDWNAGVRTVACLLPPFPADAVQGSMRGSKLVFVDDFTHGQWAKDADNSRRCQIDYPGDETLLVAKGGKGFLDPKEAGLLCVATPTDSSLNLDMVADTRLTVTVATDEPAAAADRVGFVCREGDRSRYHLTVARDGAWRIEKVTDGQLTTLSFGRKKGVIPAAGPISLRAVCTGGEQGKPVQLALWGTGGKLLGRAADPDPLPLGAVGVAIVAADPDPFSAAFDDFAVAARTS